MTQVYVKYNPYRLETTIEINGRSVTDDSILKKFTKGKRLQEWIGKFPEKLRETCNTTEVSLTFYGMALDYDDFEEAFLQAQKKFIDTRSKEGIKSSGIKYIAGKTAEDINERIVEVFNDLQEGPIDDFRDSKIEKIFMKVNDSIFPINVIATMSSGKSTLINALLGKKLMPSRNEACTATITQILDSDEPYFSAQTFDREGNCIDEISELTYETMNELNDDTRVSTISAKGNIPFLDSRDTALMLVDTPGTNNAQNIDHQKTTYREINNDSNSLILYVLNATQLSTTDDANLLDYIAEQMRKGGKQVRDRFLFVVNRMDAFDPVEENISHTLEEVKGYLSSHGIEDPQIFPCSAYTALNIRTLLADIDIDNLNRAQIRQLLPAARATLEAIDKFIDYDSMHLEQYTMLSPSAKQELAYRLAEAEKNGDTKEQALIHSGICSIEAAITAYVKKYAKTKKIKDLVDSFYEVLESSQVLVKAKTQVATDEESAKACVERAETVRQKIADGKEAEAFKRKIAELDPIPQLENKVTQLKQNADRKAVKSFDLHKDIITDREEAKRLVKQFSRDSMDAMAELSAELESLINREIINVGEQLLFEYQEKLEKFDDSIHGNHLDFQTVDLIKGTLTTMRETAESWTSDAFAAETVADVGEVTYENRIYYEKVGQEEEKVVSGAHEEKIGTKKVQVGTYQEKVDTKKVRNPNRHWWNFLFTPKYIDEPVYVTRAKYEDQDVYKTVLEYKTIKRDVFEEKTETIEKYEADTADLQGELMSAFRATMGEGLDRAVDFAKEEIKRMKEQFTDIFDELDKMIAAKYSELEECVKDQSEKEEHLKNNRKILEWIEGNMREIDEILDI